MPTPDTILETYDPVIRGTVSEWLRGKPWRLRNDRDDLIQECRLKVWQEAHRIDPEQNPKAYIRRMCWQLLNRLQERSFDADALSTAEELTEELEEGLTASAEPSEPVRGKLEAFLSRFRELRQAYICACDPSAPGGSGFSSGAWWETLACMLCDVQKAAASLTERQKDVFFRLFVLGESQTEAARVLNVTPWTVWNHTTRGLQRMTAALGTEW